MTGGGMTGGMLDRAVAHFKDAPLSKVEVPEWGGSIWFRPESAKVAAEIAGRYGRTVGEGMVATVMVRALDEAGNPAFPDHGFETLKKLRDNTSLEVLQRVYRAMTFPDVIDVLIKAKALVGSANVQDLTALSVAVDASGDIDPDLKAVLRKVIAGVRELSREVDDLSAGKS